ncbi:SubName: Full=Related to protocatechuate 3-Aspergillus oryzae {ECO:0000313/EMBL:CCA72665.1} [Serendipita indica DSM 11827]|nr:SubName: Full=Related to protocatechuate 3-Aspergillus oryzae {ECO:0000313/EMBL:CCA72665.1} [Serendipita indica DSM 11827]
MKTILPSLALALFYVSEVLGHGVERSMHPREIASRQLAANRRHVVARNCAPQIAAYQRKRKLARRALMEEKLKRRGTEFSATTSALEPHETTIRNTTCVTAPEVTEGPYYLNNDLIRQDLREIKAAFSLNWISVSLILRRANHSQTLSSRFGIAMLPDNTRDGFSTTNAGSTGGTGGGMSMSLDQSMTASGTDGGPAASASGSAGAPGAGGDGAGGVQSSSMTDSYNFLRGGWPTNANGIVTFNTIYPGFYTGRTIHIHTMVHTNITYNSNGTYTSRSGSLVHVGQMFFDDALSDKVVALSPYTSTSMTRQLNAADSILAQENSNGYSAYVDASPIDESDISKGVLGFITVGVDSTALHEVTSYNYYSGGDVYEPVDYSSTSMTTIRSGSATSTGTGIAAASSGETSGTMGRYAFGILALIRAARTWVA